MDILPGTSSEYELCGEVIVSPKHNWIGLSCKFCSHCFTNLLEFMHHLQHLHNNVIPFTNPHNVYSLEELMYPKEAPEDTLSHLSKSSSRSSDSGLPTEADYNTDAISELCVDVEKKEDLESQQEAEGPVYQTNRDLIAEVEAMLFRDEDSQPKVPEINRKRHEHSRENKSSSRKSSQNSEHLYNLKSFAIKRSKRREQTKHLSNVKNRILRSLGNDPGEGVCTSENIKKLLQFGKMKTDLVSIRNCEVENEIILTDYIRNQDEVMEQRSQKENLSKSSNEELTQLEKPSIFINSIEHLPKIDLDFILNSSAAQKPNVFSKVKHIKDKTYPESSRIEKSTSLVIPSPKQVRKRKTNEIDLTDDESKRVKTEEICIDSSNFDLSESVLNYIKMELETTQLNSESLLNLADPKDDSLIDVSYQDQAVIETRNGSDVPQSITSEDLTPKIRDDDFLLASVGLGIIKDSNYEASISVQQLQTMRSKSDKFIGLLRDHGTAWCQRKNNTPFTSEVARKLNKLTKLSNDKLSTDLNSGELKRLMNLIHAWHADQIELKSFQKVTLSRTIEYYMDRFDYLPKINGCHYFCEWCDESSSNRDRYRRHRLIHLQQFCCKLCNQSYKKRGYLINHMKVKHLLN